MRPESFVVERVNWVKKNLLQFRRYYFLSRGVFCWIALLTQIWNTR